MLANQTFICNMYIFQIAFLWKWSNRCINCCISLFISLCFFCSLNLACEWFDCVRFKNICLIEIIKNQGTIYRHFSFKRPPPPSNGYINNTNCDRKTKPVMSSSGVSFFNAKTTKTHSVNGFHITYNITQYINEPIQWGGGEGYV